MFSRVLPKKYFKPRTVVLIALMLSIGAGLLVYAKTRVKRGGPFALADQLPRGALVYAQFKDLPSLLKQWDQSPLKQQYFASANYSQFQHRHLALKLVQRWTEFNDGLGFQLDMNSLGEATDAGAAIAIYDIGRLDLIFIAPLSDEKLALTTFFKNKTQFEETELPGGITYYRREVEADNGRQKQVLAFSTIKGHFVLATSERLLLQTIANLTQSNSTDRLSADPQFKALTAVLVPHFATVWVDQTKLNDDWYFKHYWVMPGSLKGLRAGIFDLELQDGRWIERRDFLTAQRRTQAAVSVSELQRLRAMVPGEVPYVKVQSVNNNSALASALLRDVLLDRPSRKPRSGGQLWKWESYGGDGFYPEMDEESEGGRYRYLSSDYETSINDPRDAGLIEAQYPGPNPLSQQIESQFLVGVGEALGGAQPLVAAVATNPRTADGPLFVEFQRLAIVTLQQPANLKLETLESTLANGVQSRLTAAGSTSALKWVDRQDGPAAWRELELPLLGWKICYARKDSELILANSAELLAAVLKTQGHASPNTTSVAGLLDDLTVIRLDQRKQAFDSIFGKLDEEERRRRQAQNPKPAAEASPTPQFFSGEIGSLLDVAAGVRQVEIRRSSSANRLHEQIDFVMR